MSGTVLHVVHYPVFGGPHNQALRLTGPLRSAGWDTVVVLPNEPGNAVERLERAGIEVITMPLHRLRWTVNPLKYLAMVVTFVPEVLALRRLIRRRRVDVVQIGGLVNPHAAIAARLEHVPVVWQLLDTRAPRPVAVAAMLFVRLLADVVMSTGHAVARAHPGYEAIASRVLPYFPPVDLVRFLPRPESRSAVRAEWGIPPDAVVIGCVANVNPQKGTVELVDAFAGTRSIHPDVRLVIIGAEYDTHRSYSKAVRDRMSLHGLIEGIDVIFLGSRDDIEHQLAGMDVMALAAVPHSEGITTAVLEAMAAGLPVVVTDVGALREAVDDGSSGLVVPSNATGDFANALTLLAGDPSLRIRMGREARLVAEERFGVGTCAETHIHAYGRAVAHGEQRGAASATTG